MDTPPDGHSDEMAATHLMLALRELGVHTLTHWDRSPWGVAIPLLDQPDIHYESLPTLYVLTENEVKYGHRVWFGAIDFTGNEEVESSLNETHLEWLQRGTFAGLASHIAVLVELLKQGAVRSHAMLT